MTAVSVMLVPTAFVPVNSRSIYGSNAGICYGEWGNLLPSEGRGQRFESSWVRQFSAISEQAEKSALVLSLVSRPDVANTFAACSHYGRITSKHYLLLREDG